MKMKSSLIKARIGVCMLFTGLLFSCEMLHDNMDDCDLYLYFKYDHNMKKTDLFSDQVKRVDVFFFVNDTLQEHLFEEGSALSAPDYRMDISQLPRENYQIITWAGLSDDYDLEYAKGVTNIRDIKLQLLYEDKLQNDTYSLLHSDLWFGEESIKKGDWNSSSKTVNLIKNTNYFHISLGSGDDMFNESELQGYTFQLITGNGGYDYKNKPLSKKDLIYGPYGYSANEKEQWMANINTMRILEDQPARLIVKSPNGGVVVDIDLMYYIKEGSFKGEGSEMTFPEYLDRQDHFYIHFDIKNFIAISITINGWTTWLQGVEI